MQVTSIKQQVKNPGRYSIFIDGKYGFGLSADSLLESKIKLGSELTTNDIKSLKLKSDQDKLQSLTLRFVARRLRSRWEVEQYLARKEAAPATTELILNKLTDLQLIDDYEFAKRFVDNTRLLHPTSLRKLQQSLKLKHISKDIIDDVLVGGTVDYDSQALKEIIAKKQKQSRYQDKTKLMAYLARQGFNYDDIKQAFSELDND